MRNALSSFFIPHAGRLKNFLPIPSQSSQCLLESSCNKGDSSQVTSDVQPATAHPHHVCSSGSSSDYLQVGDFFVKSWIQSQNSASLGVNTPSSIMNANDQ